ncbi:hypothetical protein [uncultured Limosilactobacillus sp.]|uniref:hypothetical protein n=1 Tax=uncultured Limosilactobacillus sp. TaxID=2837629 RepID=UPI0025E6CD2C|nr:hypothetical protein [uncultured Limosilactobacillus sp.]
MDNARNHLIQTRLNDQEKEQFEHAKQLVGAQNSADAVRKMVQDELLIDRATHLHEQGQDTMLEMIKLLNGKRLPMTQVLLGIKGHTANQQLSDIQTRYQDVQAQLAGILWSATSVTNDIKEIKSILQEAAQAEPEDADTWNWVTHRLAEMHDTVQHLNVLVDQFNGEEKLGDQLVSDSDTRLPA